MMRSLDVFNDFEFKIRRHSRSRRRYRRSSCRLVHAFQENTYKYTYKYA